MAGAVDRYNRRLELQGWLDETFPRGAYWTEVYERPDGSLAPLGGEATTGRVMVSDAGEDDAGWWYELFLDPVTAQTAAEGYAWPHTARVRDLMEVEGVAGLWQGLEVSEVEQALLIRLHSDPQGPRAPEPGQRELVTERREGELFPRGMAPLTLEVVE